jgi:hypothetical protein
LLYKIKKRGRYDCKDENVRRIEKTVDNIAACSKLRRCPPDSLKVNMEYTSTQHTHDQETGTPNGAQSTHNTKDRMKGHPITSKINKRRT